MAEALRAPAESVQILCAIELALLAEHPQIQARSYAMPLVNMMRSTSPTHMCPTLGLLSTQQVCLTACATYGAARDVTLECMHGAQGRL